MADRSIYKSKKRREQADDILSLPGFEDNIIALRKKWKITTGRIKKVNRF